MGLQINQLRERGRERLRVIERGGREGKSERDGRKEKEKWGGGERD